MFSRLGTWLDQQGARVNAQRLGNIAHHGHGRILLCPFNSAKIAHIDPGFGSELLLAQPLRLPQSPDVAAKNQFPSHPEMGARNLAFRLGTLVPNESARIKYYIPHMASEQQAVDELRELRVIPLFARLASETGRLLADLPRPCSRSQVH